MPYYRKPYRKRRPYRPRRRRGGSNWFSSAYRTVAKHTNWGTMWQAIQDIKSLINVEKKWLDVTSTGTVGTTPGVSHLTNIPQGDTQNTRDGVSAKLTQLFLKFQLVMDPSVATTRTRIVVVHDCNDNGGVAPTFTQVFQAANTLAPRNLLQGAGERFKILYDGLISQSASSNNVISWKKVLRLQNHVKWSGALGTDTTVGHIYLFTVSDQATTTPTLSYYSRVRYVDN